MDLDNLFNSPIHFLAGGGLGFNHPLSAVCRRELVLLAKLGLIDIIENSYVLNNAGQIWLRSNGFPTQPELPEPENKVVVRFGELENGDRFCVASDSGMPKRAIYRKDTGAGGDDNAVFEGERHEPCYFPQDVIVTPVSKQGLHVHPRTASR